MLKGNDMKSHHAEKESLQHRARLEVASHLQSFSFARSPKPRCWPSCPNRSDFSEHASTSYGGFGTKFSPGKRLRS